MHNIDLSLYLILSPTRCILPIEEVVTKSILGGVKIVQLRDKHASLHDFTQMGLRLKKLLAPFNIPLIINDRVDVALACHADGVHLGQTDMPCASARRMLGPNAIIGLSVENWPQAEEAQQYDLDYISASSVYPSLVTKPDCKASWSLDALKKLVHMSKHPVVAIGGIDEHNAQEVIRTGVDGIVVVGAICASANPLSTAKQLTRCIVREKQKVIVG